jgi:ABC-type glycerol-3-phosphate transport system substrate-binding protein/DNA-binding transcriptional regulator YhcF (GntR family)
LRQYFFKFRLILAGYSIESGKVGPYRVCCVEKTELKCDSLMNNYDKEYIMSDSKAMPIHRKIAEEVRRQISSGELRPGQKIPSERQIAIQFDASRATVRTALQHIEQEGLITRRDRRSAIVTIKRDLTPSLRIACSSSLLARLFRKLADKQLLPHRTQISIVDMRQPEAVTQLASGTTSGADILVCNFEYAGCVWDQPELFKPFSPALVSDVNIPEKLRNKFTVNGKLTGVPCGISPMVLYYNKKILGEKGLTIPLGEWHWDQLLEIARQVIMPGRYGFQIIPRFSHFAALVSCFGGELFDGRGKVNAENMTVIKTAMKFIETQINAGLVPRLSKEAQVNLFAQGRCAMAIDGIGAMNSYREALGADCGVACLPGSRSGSSITGGFVILAMRNQEENQLIEDVIRNLLILRHQQIIAGSGLLMPVHGSVLNFEGMKAAGLPDDVAGVFATQTRDAAPANVPCSVTATNNFQDILYELWMGLDSVDNLCRRMG